MAGMPGLDGFGDETELDDWIGGLEAWRALKIILAAAQRENPDLAKKLEAWMRGDGPLPEFHLYPDRRRGSRRGCSVIARRRNMNSGSTGKCEDIERSQCPRKVAPQAVSVYRIGSRLEVTAWLRKLAPLRSVGPPSSPRRRRRPRAR